MLKYFVLDAHVPESKLLCGWRFVDFPWFQVGPFGNDHLPLLLLPVVSGVLFNEEHLCLLFQLAVLCFVRVLVKRWVFRKLCV